jgi:hypothetical protein
MSNMPFIPRHEPEIIKAWASKRNGDYEKIPTTSIEHLIVDGITLDSLYDKAEEYEVMATMVEDLPINLKQYVISIFCDSNATNCYCVTLKACTQEQAHEIGWQLGFTCMKKNGGHNGIDLQGPLGGDVYVNPDWVEDEI